MNRLSFLILGLLFLMAVSACKPVLLEQQQATATAFVRSDLELGRQAAEQSALVLCNVDFKQGKAAYQKSICDLSTEMGCRMLSTQVDETWESFSRAYPVPNLACELRSSQLLEESRQFGLPVQYRLVTLHGMDGWPKDVPEHEYWLQVAKENGAWKLNRVLVLDEARYYSILQTNQKKN
jgi:hypothetical protein